MPSNQGPHQGLASPLAWEGALPTACCAAVALAAGAAATLQLAGKVKGGPSLVAVEVGAAFTCTGYLVWRLFRGEASPTAAGDAAAAAVPVVAAGGAARKAAEGGSYTSDGCCGGACGCGGSSEAAAEQEETAEEEEAGEADMEDLQDSEDEFKRVARAAKMSTYLQPKAARRRAASQLVKESNDDKEELTTAAAAPAAGEAAAASAAALAPAGVALNDEAAFLPGRSKVYFKTFGCSHNISDSEYMRTLL